MRRHVFPVALMVALAVTGTAVSAEPPFAAGTVEALRDTFTNPPEEFRSGRMDWFFQCDAAFQGRDRKVIEHVSGQGWRERPVFLYAGFCGSTPFEVWADVQIGKDVADEEVWAMLGAISALPDALIRDFRVLRIHPGNRQPTFSVNLDGVIDTSPRARHIFAQDGMLEEVFFHEFAHWRCSRTELKHPWRHAQRADGEFISAYAASRPTREDCAETMLAWYALRFRPWTMPPRIRTIIRETIPNRLTLLDRCASGWC